MAVQSCPRCVRGQLIDRTEDGDPACLQCGYVLIAPRRVEEGHRRPLLPVIKRA